MKGILIGLFILSAVSNARPCIWITGTKYNGSSVTTGITRYIFLKQAEKEDLALKGRQMTNELNGSTDFNDRSDYSVALMYLGRNSEAIERLKQLETEKPGQYFIAANLGTAYELAGDNTNALYWIKEGIRRNADSHYGTEWLHVRILEEKIAHGADTNYFQEHSVLGLRPENIEGVTNAAEQYLSPEQVGDALNYQLRERIQFVKPQNPLIGGLLFDFAAIEANTKTLESAEKLLRMSEEYGYSQNQVEPLIKAYDQKIATRKTRQFLFHTFWILAGLVTLGVLYKKGIFVLSSKSLKPRT